MKLESLTFKNCNTTMTIGNIPILYYVFDLLQLNGKDLYNLPLINRKELLEEFIEPNDVVKYSDHVDERGEDFFEVTKQQDLEGMMAKKRGSFYYPGKRSADWLKVKHHKTEEVIIAGFTAPRGGRKYFGALVLATRDKDGQLMYAGHTGSGFNEVLLKELWNLLQPIIRNTSPFSSRVKTNMPVTWVEPTYVCEIKFTEWTSDGKLRHPIFLRLRDDKAADELNPKKPAAMETTSKKLSDKQPIKKATKAAAKKSPVKQAAAKKAKALPAKTISDAVVKNDKDKVYSFGKSSLKTTNRTKVFFPEGGYTKGDVIDYYDTMADLLLPYLKDRPESLFRTPNGIDQKGFFHKDAGDDAPAFVKHILLPSGSAKRSEIDYILCNNKATLLYLANLGCIEINPWHSTTKALDNPDYVIIDIDPSDNNTFDQVVEAAIAVKAILDQAGAVGFCKTSGSSGLHIYIPLGKKYDYEQAKNFANIICMMAAAQLPDLTTLERSLAKRSKDKIYMDYLQNRKAQTIASVYSLRPRPGATVSTPLDWSEVKKGLSPKWFTIETVPKRVLEKGDLFAGVLDKKNAVNIATCLENLGG